MHNENVNDPQMGIAVVHLLEPTHNARFVSLMGSFVPKLQFYREALNRLPVRHEQSKRIAHPN
jgi:hypothetical protein